MTMKRLLTFIFLIASFSALAIPPIPPESIQKPIKTSNNGKSK
jgi:hypothetical protein